MDERIDRDRLSVVTGALLLAFALARLLEAPVRAFQVTVFGSPLGFTLSEMTIMLLIIGGMAATGVESLVCVHPLVQEGKVRRTVVFWIVPALLAMALAVWLDGIADVGLWTLGMIATAVLIPLALVAEYAAVSPHSRRDTLLQWAYSVLIHLVALILFSALYDARLRALVGGPLIFVGATLLAARLFWAQTNDTQEAAIFGAVVGLVLAELLLVLNYWPLSGLQGGLVLFLGFYMLAGLLQQHLTRRSLDRRLILEYGGIAVLALLAILIAVP